MPGDVAVHHCMRCQGTFLRPAAATSVFGPGGAPVAWLADPAVRATRPSTLRSPVDGQPMTAYALDGGTGLFEVDVCMRSGGLFLDPGEARKLHHALAARPAQTARAPGEPERPGVLSYVFQVLTGLPIEVQHPTRRTPWMTWLFVVGLIAAFVNQVAILAPMNKAQASVWLAHWAVVPDALVHGRGLLGVLTHAFLHGGIGHLLGNLYFLWVFGDNIEDTLGRRRFIVLYLGAAVCGALLHTAVNPSSTAPMLGASGAIAGLMGAYLVLFPRVRVWMVLFFIRFQMSVLWYLGFWVAMQAAMLWAQAQGIATPPVAWGAHLGGFCAGLIIGLLARQRAVVL